LTVWGFGMLYGEPGRGGVFVPRAGFAQALAPYAAPPTTVWSPSDLPPFAAPQSEAERR